MATVQVAASTDDADQYGTGGMALTGTVIKTYASGADASKYHGGYRFTLAIPKGATILTAFPSFYVYNTGFDDANFDMYFEKGASPATFTTSANNLTGRSLTTASVAWVENSVAAAGAGWFNGASLVTPLQEVVNAYTTTTVVLITKAKTGAGNFGVYAYDQAGNVSGAKLTVTYSEATPSAWFTLQLIKGGFANRK